MTSAARQVRVTPDAEGGLGVRFQTRQLEQNRNICSDPSPHLYYTEGMTNLHPHQRLSSACYHDGVHRAAASLLSTMALVSLAGGGILPASRRQRQTLAAPAGCLASHKPHARANLPYSRCPCRRLYGELGVWGCSQNKKSDPTGSPSFLCC